MKDRPLLPDFRLWDLVAPSLAHGLLLAVLTLLAAAFHFLPWHFFQDIEGPAGNGPSTALDFAILATVLGVPGLWLTWKFWLSLWDDADAVVASLLGFGLLLVTDAAAAASWGWGFPVTRYQAFAVAYVLMASASTVSFWLECREPLPRKPIEPLPSPLEMAQLLAAIQAAAATAPTVPPSPPPRHGRVVCHRPAPGASQCRPSLRPRP